MFQLTAKQLFHMTKLEMPNRQKPEDQREYSRCFVLKNTALILWIFQWNWQFEILDSWPFVRYSNTRSLLSVSIDFTIIRMHIVYFFFIRLKMIYEIINFVRWILLASFLNNLENFDLQPTEFSLCRCIMYQQNYSSIQNTFCPRL